MIWQHTPYTLPLLISAALSGGVVAYIYRRRRSPGAGALLTLMCGVVVWTLGYALQMASVDADAVFFWSAVQFMGVLTVPTLWFVFALKYTGRAVALRGWRYWLLPVPIATAMMVWTNPYHHFFWVRLRPYQYPDFLVTELDHGPGFWLHASYSYVLLLVGTVILLRALFRSPPGYRPQLGAALLGAGAPWLANALSIFDLTPFRHLDLTPFAFIVSGLCFGWGLFRYHLLDLVPVARDLVVERLRDAFLVLDEQLRIVDLNAVAREILGAGAYIGRPARELLPMLAPMLSEVARGEVDDEVALQVGDALHHYEVDLLPMSTGSRKGPGYLLVLHDATARHRAEARLVRLKEEADGANRAKSRFFAHMNHELRNPLTGIMGHADMLEQGVLGALTARQQKSVSAIVAASTQLLDMINESLEMARIEADRVMFYVEDFAVTDLVNELMDTIRPLVTRNDNLLAVTGADGAGGMRADRGKVRQCLLNLLTNAAKFTRQGSVALHISREERDDGEWLSFGVADTGMGIPTEDLESIFEPFAQAEQETATRLGGTGLGLAITRNFAQLMGGGVAVESQVGEGSTFTLSLPAGAQLGLLDGDRRAGEDRRRVDERRAGDERRTRQDRRDRDGGHSQAGEEN